LSAEMAKEVEAPMDRAVERLAAALVASKTNAGNANG
jgi:hypothetical protein